ncbi:saccharopine dehydrogenase NADP-binding domain-containing protein [Scleromatobacter humisilvae]|uniref:Saccharopine dehydrogenase NADP-binding domain-containing protein n=1 Tax=Scleromatobacter humisilvae TaxID=2897159 RepID=A0A9X2C078_9BURK|nr:saccharopine dehydrogenase NADP-binding domain-containing protein [Scleromatobacter humisilvae]MCK9687047.1 saccharopine dehydrogenase NADP-binding domain-containing protein [Scleromatobacter humisilvae]
MSSPSTSEPYRVLVIGGYGFFGRRLVERLSRQAGLHVIVAGRSAQQASALLTELRSQAQATLGAIELDAMSDELPGWLDGLRVRAVVNASGPFQGQDYRVALACTAAGVHCIDLADGRDFVAGVAAVDVAATAAGVCVLSGASSVPALSGAAVDDMTRGWQRVDEIDIGISPGNRTERGLSTIRAGLSYCGRPIRHDDGRTLTGWLRLRLHRYPAPVGWRPLSPCDVPDLDLLPARHPGRPRVRFGAGLELFALHFGMNAMALAGRLGLVRDWTVHAPWLKRWSDRFATLGSDAGAMHVSVRGLDDQGRRARRTWTLLATDGDGPFVPTLAAAALVRKLAAGQPPAIGARPCVGELTLDDFARETDGRHISWKVA